MPTIPGPLAGIAAALHVAVTDYVLIAPCDAPFVDERLCVTLIQALRAANAGIAYAATIEHGERIAHPVFALLRVSLAANLDAWLATGERKVRVWYARHSAVEMPFQDNRAFYNINDLQQLADLECR